MGRPFTLVGARQRAHLHLLSPSISKCHAILVNDRGTLYVRDLASRDHVFVNGKQVRETDLKNGDLVKFGSFTFKFVDGSGKARGKPTNRAPEAELEISGSSLPMPFDGRVMVIGRRPGCDVVLDEQSVSTIHAAIFEFDGRHYIRDLGSRTGTLVNGQPVHHQPLELNDAIRVGDTEMRYVPASVIGNLDELEHLIGTASLGTETAELARHDAAAVRPAPANLDPDTIPLAEPEAAQELAATEEDAIAFAGETPAAPAAAVQPATAMPITAAAPDLTEIDLASDPDVSGSEDTAAMPPTLPVKTQSTPVLSSRVVDSGEVPAVASAEPAPTAGAVEPETDFGLDFSTEDFEHPANASDETIRETFAQPPAAHAETELLPIDFEEHAAQDTADHPHFATHATPTPEPEATALEPEAMAAEVEAIPLEPEAASVEAETLALEPEAPVHEPEPLTHESQAIEQEAEGLALEPQAYDPATTTPAPAAHMASADLADFEAFLKDEALTIDGPSDESSAPAPIAEDILPAASATEPAADLLEPGTEEAVAPDTHFTAPTDVLGIEAPGTTTYVDPGLSAPATQPAPAEAGAEPPDDFDFLTGFAESPAEEMGASAAELPAHAEDAALASPIAEQPGTAFDEAESGLVFADEAAPGEAPVNESPIGELPLHEAPTGESPADQSPIGEPALDEALLGEALLDEARQDGVPLDEINLDAAPVGGVLTGEAPAEEFAPPTAEGTQAAPPPSPAPAVVAETAALPGKPPKAGKKKEKKKRGLSRLFGRGKQEAPEVVAEAAIPELEPQPQAAAEPDVPELEAIAPELLAESSEPHADIPASLEHAPQTDADIPEFEATLLEQADDSTGAVAQPIEEQPPVVARSSTPTGDEIAFTAADGAFEEEWTEVVARTDPTPESALDLDAHIEQPADAPSDVATADALSDTSFGLAVSDFSGSALGALVEQQSAPSPAAESPATHTAAESESAIEPEAIPADGVLDEARFGVGSHLDGPAEPTGDPIVDSAAAFLAHEEDSAGLAPEAQESPLAEETQSASAEEAVPPAPPAMELPPAEPAPVPEQDTAIFFEQESPEAGASEVEPIAENGGGLEPLLQPIDDATPRSDATLQQFDALPLSSDEPDALADFELTPETPPSAQVPSTSEPALVDEHPTTTDPVSEFDLSFTAPEEPLPETPLQEALPQGPLGEEAPTHAVLSDEMTPAATLHAETRSEEAPPAEVLPDAIKSEAASVEPPVEPVVRPAAAPPVKIDPLFGMTRDFGTFLGGIPLALPPLRPKPPTFGDVRVTRPAAAAQPPASPGVAVNEAPAELPQEPPAELPSPEESAWQHSPAEAPEVDDAATTSFHADEQQSVTYTPPAQVPHELSDEAFELSEATPDESETTPELFDATPEALDTLPDTLEALSDVTDVIGEAAPEAHTSETPAFDAPASELAPPELGHPDHAAPDLAPPTVEPEAFAPLAPEPYAPPAGKRAAAKLKKAQPVPSDDVTALPGATKKPKRPPAVTPPPRPNLRRSPAPKADVLPETPPAQPAAKPAAPEPGAIAMPPVFEVDVFSEMPVGFVAPTIPSVDEFLPQSAPATRRKAQRTRIEEAPLTPQDLSAAELHNELVFGELLNDPLPVDELPAEPRPSLPPRKKPRKFPFYFTILVMALTAAAASGVWYGLPTNSNVKAALRFEGLDKVSETARRDFFRQRVEQLRNETRVQAREIYEAADFHGRKGKGFLYPIGDDAPYQLILSQATVEGDKLVLKREGTPDGEGDRLRFRALLRALYSQTKPIGDAAATQRHVLEQKRAELAGKTQEVAKLNEQIQGEQLAQAKYSRALDDEKALVERGAFLEKIWRDATEKLRKLKADLEAMQAAEPAAAVAASPDDDPQVREMAGRLKQLSDSIAAARGDQAADPAKAAQALDTALGRVQQEIMDDRAAQKDGSPLTAYLTRAQQIVESVRQAGTELTELQTTGRQTLATVQRSLVEKVDAHLKAAWAADPELMHLEQDLQVKQHRLGAASGAGLAEEADKLRTEIAGLNKSIHARRGQVAAADTSTDDIKNVQKVVADERDRLQRDQARPDQRMADELKALAGAAPKPDGLSADQKAVVERLGQKMAVVSAARRQLAQGITTSLPATDGKKVEGLELQAAELQARMDAFHKQFAADSAPGVPATGPADDARATQLSRKRVEVEVGERAVAMAFDEWLAAKKQLVELRSGLDRLKDAAATLVADKRNLFQLQNDLNARLKDIERQAATTAALIPHDPDRSDDSVQVSPAKDLRGSVIGALAILSAFVTGWRFARSGGDETVPYTAQYHVLRRPRRLPAPRATSEPIAV
jgi:pSer/pThr/pTyr-binding forkhead associated (FHA) protein